MSYATLAELRAKLRARTGFSAAGAAAGVNQEHFNAILQDAQNVLYWTHDWVKLKLYETLSLGADEYLLDYPTQANPERVKAISVLLNGTTWTPAIKKGIPPELYSTQDNTSWPQRWEPYEQIEFWPKADQIYPVRVFYIKALDRFTQNNDRATIDDDLIFTLALGDAKAHYGHKDAQIYQNRANTLLTTLKAKSWGQSVFDPNDYEEAPVAKPQVV